MMDDLCIYLTASLVQGLISFLHPSPYGPENVQRDMARMDNRPVPKKSKQIRTATPTTRSEPTLRSTSTQTVDYSTYNEVKDAAYYHILECELSLYKEAIGEPGIPEFDLRCIPAGMEPDDIIPMEGGVYIDDIFLN